MPIFLMYSWLSLGWRFKKKKKTKNKKQNKNILKTNPLMGRLYRTDQTPLTDCGLFFLFLFSKKLWTS